MAQRKRKGAKVNPKAAARQKAGGDTAGEIIKNVALFAIPGGGLVRIGMTGGKIASGALQALRRMFPKAKRVSKPTKSQIDKAKPVSALKPMAKPSGPATRGGRRGPRKNEVIEGKAVEKSSTRVTTTAKPKPKPADKKPGTAVTTRPGTQVKKPGTGVMEIRPGATPKRGMKMAQGTDKARELKKVRANIAAAKKANNASLVKKLIAAAVAAGLVGSAAMLGGGTDKPAAGGAGKKKTVPTPTPKPKQKKRKPTGTYERTPVETSKPKKPTRKPSGPQTRGSQKRGATPRITAGPNTGFGPKGNIFPSNTAERAALMKMYGGTGSAAAKAAAAGKQGDLTAGKAAYEKAKRERLKGKK
tara:strand:- start:915 stop:1991 length:1077 start_codon:yes stop_codon:yes gene_type:complete